jgi:CO/xanthine dehydrogenase Mo-binding subunit
MEELAHLVGVRPEELTRAHLPKSGPVILDGGTLPWTVHSFRRVWREIADEVGVPKDVKNRDTRGTDDSDRSGTSPAYGGRKRRASQQERPAELSPAAGRQLN